MCWGNSDPQCRLCSLNWKVNEFRSLYCCETWPLRVGDERTLEVFDNDSIGRILRVRRWDCVPSVELRRRLCLTSISVLLVQRRLLWFGHAARRPEGELIKGLLLPTSPRTWRRRAGGQLKTRATTIKATWNRSPDRESSATHDGERTGWKCLVSCTGPPSLECLRTRRGQCSWLCRLNPPRVNADESTSTK